MMESGILKELYLQLEMLILMGPGVVWRKIWMNGMMRGRERWMEMMVGIVVVEWIQRVEDHRCLSGHHACRRDRRTSTM
ncbi:hypothetical protein QJS10_CPA02g00592 [Acorus calamus]|uniref:Uncharacterized protein n=1 Tax=Acorus calamus TaxID=4465 RepID=A0AAV9FE99_ACOCL|nr:hypothetical protein QJS10_CPA02g00592 [Acorus calamus]